MITDRLLKRIICMFLSVTMVFSCTFFAVADESTPSEIVIVENEIENEKYEATPSDIEFIDEYEEDDEAEDIDIEYEEEPEDEIYEDTIASDSEIMEEIVDEEEPIATESEINDEETIDEIDLIATESEVIYDVIATESEAIYDVAATGSEIIDDMLLYTVATQSESENEEYGLGFIRGRNTAPAARKLFRTSNFGSSSLPESYDARTETNSYGMSIVPPIRNQGSYGTCWAFSTLGMMETSLRKKDLVSNETNSNLSELALAYYFFNLDTIYTDQYYMDKPGLEGHDYTKLLSPVTTANNWAKFGGNQMMATLFLSAYVGAAVENADIAYSDTKVSDAIRNGLNKKYAYKTNSFEIANVYYYNKTETDKIKKAIIDNGSVGISYYEGRDNYININEGKYYYLSDKANDDSANHAVMVVGWDDNIPSEKFSNALASTTNNGGWLVRNSWGDTSRNDGYFWMSYDEKSIYETVFSVDAIKSDEYKYNYHYDTTGIDEIEEFYSGDIISNVFKVSDIAQELKAINIALLNTNTNIDIEIYTKDTAMNNPTDGTLKLTQNFIAESAGIYTIPLSSVISLTKNTYYSIVIKPNVTTKIFVDYSCEFDGVKFANYANRGQSLYKQGSSAWSDLNTSDNVLGKNFRIKGLANPTEAEPIETEPTENPPGPVSQETVGPSGRRSSGGGGGGGGGAALQTLPSAVSQVPKQSEAKTTVVRTADIQVLSTDCEWVYDAITDTWGLNPDKNNKLLKATNGFYNVVSTDILGNVVNDVYNFDNEGKMVTGWVKDPFGTMYFFNTIKGNDIGKMVIGWKEIGTGLWYYFGADGKMLANTITPDGSVVGADGLWQK